MCRLVLECIYIYIYQLENRQCLKVYYSIYVFHAQTTPDAKPTKGGLSIVHVPTTSHSNSSVIFDSQQHLYEFIRQKIYIIIMNICWRRHKWRNLSLYR